MFRKIFQVSADEGMGINKVNVWSFQLKNVSKFVIAWLVREKQNILTPQPCLHTLMQTRLSANQSAHTILVNLWRSIISLPQGQSFTDRKYFLTAHKIFSLGLALALRKANFVIHILVSFVSFYTHQLTSGYSISLIRDPARETCQFYLRVAWTSAFKQFFLNSCCLTNEKIYCL